MAHRIILNQDFEGYKKGGSMIVRNEKLKQMKKDKIDFTIRLVASTGNREYKFEQKDKEEIIINKKNKN